MEMVCYKQPPQSAFSRASCEPSAIDKITGTITDECNNRYYCVKWKETWEPEEALRDCSVLVNEFWESRGGVVAISCTAQESDKKHHLIARSSAQPGNIAVYRKSDGLSISGKGKVPVILGGSAKVRHARKRLPRSEISKSTAAALSALPRLAGSSYITHCSEVNRVGKSMEQAPCKSNVEGKGESYCMQTDDGVNPRPCARRMIAKASQTDDSLCTQTSCGCPSKILTKTIKFDTGTGEKLVNIAQVTQSGAIVLDNVYGQGSGKNDGTLGNALTPMSVAAPIVGSAEVFDDGPNAQGVCSNRCQISQCGLACGRGLPTAHAGNVIGTRFEQSPSEKCVVGSSIESFSDSEPSCAVNTALAVAPDGDCSNPSETSSERGVSSEPTCPSAFDPFVSRVESQHSKWQKLCCNELLDLSQSLLMTDPTTIQGVMVDNSSLPTFVAEEETTAAEKKIKRPVTDSVGCDAVLVKRKKPCNSPFLSRSRSIDGFDVMKSLSQESPQSGELSFRVQSESAGHSVVEENNISQAWDAACAGTLRELSGHRFDRPDLPQISSMSENCAESNQSAPSSEHNPSLKGENFASGTGSESLCLPMACSALGEQACAEIRALHSLIEGKSSFRADMLAVNAPANTSCIAVCLPNSSGANSVAVPDRLVEPDDPNRLCNSSSPVSSSDIVLIKGAASAKFSSIDDATISCKSAPSANIKVVDYERLLSADSNGTSCEILSTSDRRMADSSIATSTCSHADALAGTKVSSVIAWKDLADRNSPCVIGVADGLEEHADHRCGTSFVGKARASVVSQSLKSSVSTARMESESNSTTLKVKVECSTPDAQSSVSVSSGDPEALQTFSVLQSLPGLQTLPGLQSLPGLRIPRSTLKRALSTSSFQRKVAAIAKSAVSGSRAVVNFDALKAAPVRVVDGLHYPVTINCRDVRRNAENDLPVSHVSMSARDPPIISAPPVPNWLDVACTQGLAKTAGTFILKVPLSSPKLCTAIVYVPGSLVAAAACSSTSAALKTSGDANIATTFSSSVVGSSPFGAATKPSSVCSASCVATTSASVAFDAKVSCVAPHTSSCSALASSISVGVASSLETTVRGPAVVRQGNTPEAKRIFYLSRHAACFPPFSSGRCPRIATVSASSPQVPLGGRKHERGEKVVDVPNQVAAPLDASTSQPLYTIASPKTATSFSAHARVSSRPSSSVTTGCKLRHPTAETPKSQVSADSISALPPTRMRSTENVSVRHTSVDLAKLSTSILMSSIPELQSSFSRKREDQEMM